MHSNAGNPPDEYGCIDDAALMAMEMPTAPPAAPDVDGAPTTHDRVVDQKLDHLRTGMKTIFTATKELIKEEAKKTRRALLGQMHDMQLNELGRGNLVHVYQIRIKMPPSDNHPDGQDLTTMAATKEAADELAELVMQANATVQVVSMEAVIGSGIYRDAMKNV
jgi:hypothetical protein